MQTLDQAAALPFKTRTDFHFWAVSLALGALYLVLGIAAATASTPSLASLAASAILAGALIALSTIDYATYRLPDLLTFSLIAAGFALTLILNWDSLAWRMTSAALGYSSFWLFGFLYQKLRHHDGLGLGDAKLLAAGGSWLGAEHLDSVVLWATTLALATVAIRSLRAGAFQAKDRIAFGPFLALGIWLVWLGWSI